MNPVPGIRSRGIAALPFGDDAHSPTTGEASRGTGGVPSGNPPGERLKLIHSYAVRAFWMNSASRRK